MKKNTLITFGVLIVSLMSNPAYSQEQLVPNSVPLISPEEKLQALASTRFHFITLKQFHSALFRFVDEHINLTNFEAALLNAGLNEFLASSEREMMLLDALRENKSIRIEPSAETAVEVKPLLDRPIAFQITLTENGERHFYDVDWSGNVIPSSF